MASALAARERRAAERAREVVDGALQNHRGQGTLATLLVGLPVPAVGVCAYALVDFPCVVQAATLLADAAGELAVEIERAPTLANFAVAPAPSTASITGGVPVALVGERCATDGVLAGWSPVLVAGCVLVVSIVACTGVATASLCLTVRRT